ncbi:MAG: hypothetical protein ACTSP3_00595, partial [Candidatus Heimdallarchaeaceae archaeon]
MKKEKMFFGLILLFFLLPIIAMGIQVNAETNTVPEFIGEHVWRYPEQPTQFDNVIVFCEVKSDDGIRDAKLIYSVNGISETVHMKYIFSYFHLGEVYKGIIPRKDTGNIISYQIELTDGSSDSLTTTSLVYYYRVAEDGAPRIVSIDSLERKFIISDSVENEDFSYSIYDADDIKHIDGNEYDINFYYQINNGEILKATKIITGEDTEKNIINCTFILPSAYSMELNIYDSIYYWVEATDVHNQKGSTRIKELKVIGNEPYINNVHLTPSVPESNNKFKISAEIFYKQDSISLTNIEAVYTINTLSQNALLTEQKTNKYFFNTSMLNQLSQIGILEVQLEISYSGEYNGIVSKSFYFSVTDSCPPSLVSNHLIFTNSEPTLKFNKQEVANVEAYIYDNVRTHNVIAWFEDSYGSHGVVLNRKDTEYFSYIGEYGDDGISFCENNPFNNTIRDEGVFDGLILKQEYIDWISWESNEINSQIDLTLKEGLTKSYVGIDLKNFLNFNNYVNLALTLKASTDNIRFLGIKSDIDSPYYAWEYQEVLSNTEFETINAYNFELTNSNIQNSKKLWLIFESVTGNFTNDHLIIDKIRLHKLGCTTDNDFAVYSGSYLPVGQNTTIDCYLSIRDYSEIVYTPRISELGGTKLSVVDGLPPTLTINTVMGVDYKDEFIPVYCVVEDDSETYQPILYYRFHLDEDHDGVIDYNSSKTYDPCVLMKITEQEYYCYIYPENFSLSSFVYKMIIEYYIEVSDNYNNLVSSELKTIEVSEKTLPDVILSSNSTTISTKTDVEVYADVFDAESGIKEVTFCWTTPTGESQSSTYTNGESLLVLPNETSVLIEKINGSSLTQAGYLYWYVIIEDGEGNIRTSDIQTLIIIDDLAPLYQNGSFNVLNGLKGGTFIGYKENPEISIVVQDQSMITSISLTAIIKVKSSSKTYPGTINWGLYSHQENLYNYTFTFSKPSVDDNFWVPSKIISFQLTVVDVYGNWYNKTDLPTITIVDNIDPILSLNSFIIPDLPSTYASINFTIKERTNVTGFIY